MHRPFWLHDARDFSAMILSLSVVVVGMPTTTDDGTTFLYTIICPRRVILLEGLLFHSTTKNSQIDQHSTLRGLLIARPTSTPSGGAGNAVSTPLHGFRKGEEARSLFSSTSSPLTTAACCSAAIHNSATFRGKNVLNYIRNNDEEPVRSLAVIRYYW